MAKFRTNMADEPIYRTTEELFAAIREGSVSKLKRLLQVQRLSPNSRVGDEACTPALIYSVQKNRIKCFKLLLQERAKVDDRDTKGNTACMFAATYGLLEFLKGLTRYGADFNAVDKKGETSMMIAARWGRDECLQYIIRKAGIDHVDDMDNNGQTALMLAAKQNEHKCLRILIGCGANTNLVDKHGYSALMHALQHRSEQCATILLDSGVDVNVVANDNQTTTMTVAINATKQCGDYTLVERLLQMGADMTVSRQDQDYMHEIIARGKQKLVRLMLINGCPPLDRRCREHFFNFSHHEVPISPLAVALLSGFYGIAKYFIANRFLTKYDVTVLPNDPEIRRKLQNLGADGSDALSVLEHFCSAPQSLKVLSFVAISEAFSSATAEGQCLCERRTRIRNSCLPPSLIRELLFQGQASRVCVLYWHDLSLDTDQQIEICHCEDCGPQGGYSLRNSLSALSM